MTTNSHQAQCFSFEIVETFEVLAEAFGLEEARTKLQRLGADENLVTMAFEDHLAKHAHDQYATETRIYRWSHQDPE